jgi:hypothetical protein
MTDELIGSKVYRRKQRQLLQELVIRTAYRYFSPNLLARMTTAQLRAYAKHKAIRIVSAELKEYRKTLRTA